MDMNSQEILSSWKAFVEQKGLEKSKIPAKTLHSYQQFDLRKLISSYNSNGVILKFLKKQTDWLHQQYIKIDANGKKSCPNVYLLFPLINSVELEQNKQVSKLIPLFMFDVRQWLLEKNDCFDMLLPIYSGDKIIPLVNTFKDTRILDFDLKEVGEDRSFISIVGALTKNKNDDFITSFNNLLEKINENTKNNKYLKIENAFNSVICEINISDYNTRRDLMDYAILEDKSLSKFSPLLNNYINKTVEENDYNHLHIPEHPIYGLFETDYPLGRGQIETISRVNHGEQLLAVQGAPGTGKTTLFKSFIANFIVNKAFLFITDKNSNIENNSLIVTSTAIKAVENVVDDLKMDPCTKDISWLYFHGGSKERIKLEIQRIDTLESDLKNSTYSKSEHVKISSEIIKLKAKIDNGFSEFTQLNKDLNKILHSAEVSSYEDMLLNKQNIIGKCIKYADYFNYKLNDSKNFKKHIVWIKNENQKYKNKVKKYDKAKSKFKTWQALTPNILPINNLIPWLNSGTSELIERQFKDYPKAGFLKLFRYIYPGKYREAWEQLHLVYSKELLILGLEKKSSLYRLGILARLRIEINNAENSTIILNLIREGNPDSTIPIELGKFEIQIKKLNTLSILSDEYKIKFKKLTTVYPEGDWLNIQRLRYISEQRKLFENSIKFLWLELLKEKKSVIEVLLHWKEMLLGNLASGFYKWKDNLDEFYRLLSLAYPIQASPVVSAYKLPGYKLQDIENIKPFQLCLCDESGMISVESLLPLLCRSKNAVIVGDPLQLEPIWEISKYSAEQLRKQYYNKSNSDYERVSPALVTAFHRAAGTETGDVHAVGNNVLLDEHRRCQKPIADLFMDLAGYSGLSIKTAAPSSRINTAFKNMAGYHRMFYSVQGKAGDLPSTNLDEVEAIGEILTKLEEAGYDLTKDVGVITSYKNQRNLLIKRWGQRLQHTVNIKIGTIHQFQGIEFEVIIYSSVIFAPADKSYFQNRRPNLLNVAISRAKQQFIIIGNYRKLMLSGGYLKKVADICANDFIIDIEHQSPSYNDNKENPNLVRGIYDCDHIDAFENLIKQAKLSVKVVVPWIRKNGQHPQFNILKFAKNRGIDVSIYYGYYSSTYKYRDDGDIHLIEQYKKEFGNNLIRLASGTHEKLLIIDDKTSIIGSWNWLSHNYHKYCLNSKMKLLQIRREASVEVEDASLVEEFDNRLALSEPV